MRVAGEVAQSIDFTDATSILTILSGDLTLDEGTTGDLIDMPSGGTINISSGGTLRLQNGDNGIDGRDIIVNNSGQLIFDDLDIFDEVGYGVAYDKTFPITVLDGVLDITLENVSASCPGSCAARLAGVLVHDQIDGGLVKAYNVGGYKTTSGSGAVFSRDDGVISQQRFDSYLRMVEEFKDSTNA